MIELESLIISEDFLQICRMQLSLLFSNYFADESVIYLTDNGEKEAKLIPILYYPDRTNTDIDTNDSLLPPCFNNPISDNLQDSLEDESLEKSLIRYNLNSPTPHQLILPLIYQDLVLGLLATNRKNKPWQPSEIIQIEKVVKTITNARIIEQKQQLAEAHLTRLKQLNQLENDYKHDFLHQLRNPLTSIRTFAKLLLKKIIPEDANYQTIQYIIHECDRIRDLIADFSQQWQTENIDNNLSLPKSHTSFFLTEKIENLEKIDINEIISPIIESSKIIAQEKNIKIFANNDGKEKYILTNKKALTEIVNNLLDNAIKYTPDNGKILVEVEKENQEFIQLKISDTGYGIPEDEQERIFERHYRGSQEKSEISGTGLGLAIVKELCQKIHVNIELISPYHWLKNQKNLGSQFLLSIPQA